MNEVSPPETDVTRMAVNVNERLARLLTIAP